MSGNTVAKLKNWIPTTKIPSERLWKLMTNLCGIPLTHPTTRTSSGTEATTLTPSMMAGTARRFKTSFLFTCTSAEPERNLCPHAKDVSAHYLVSLCPWAMKVTASNLTCRDGNLSDTLNNLLMQKLKGLSVSAGGGEESRALDNRADVQNAGFCPSAEDRQTAAERSGGIKTRLSAFELAFIWNICLGMNWIPSGSIEYGGLAASHKFHHGKTVYQYITITFETMNTFIWWMPGNGSSRIELMWYRE